MCTRDVYTGVGKTGQEQRYTFLKRVPRYVDELCVPRGIPHCSDNNCQAVPREPHTCNVFVTAQAG